MTETPLIFDLLKDVGLPVLTAVGGWFASVWRTKQKKEKDVLENVKQILEMQKEYIADQDAENKKTRDMNSRLEKKLDEKNASIRKANHCKYTNEGDGCPVLAHENMLDERCKQCEHYEDRHDHGEA